MAGNIKQEKLNRTLLALRAGPMDTSQLWERFPTGHHADKLCKMGLAEPFGESSYKITAKGRTALINRSDQKPPSSVVKELNVKNAREGKSRSQEIFEYLQANGLTDGAVLNKVFKIASPHSYLLGYMKAGKVFKHYITEKTVAFEVVPAYQIASAKTQTLTQTGKAA